MSTPGTQLLDGEPLEGALEEPPLGLPPDGAPEPPRGRPPTGGTTGGGGGGAGPGGGAGAGGGFGNAVQGIGCLSSNVTPWCVALWAFPLDPAPSPPPPVAVPVPPVMVLVAVTSTVILLTFTAPIDQLSTSECVTTVRLPFESATVVRVLPAAPLNGCCPPPA